MHQLRHRDPIGRHARQEALALEATLGSEMYAQTVAASVGVHAPVPVLYPGTRSFLHHGELYPQIEGGGFSSLSDLIAEMTGSKRQDLVFNKAGATGVVGTAAHLWLVGSSPVAGAAGGTTGTGVARNSASQGALLFTDPTGGDTTHVIGGTFQGSVGTQMLVLYDRLWDMTHTMTVDPRSVDNATPPTRYQDSTAAGTLITGEVTTVLPAATPTITFDYIDQGGNVTTGPTFSTIRSAAAVNSSPFPLGTWFYPLASGDTGVRRIGDATTGANGVNLSAAMASGVVTWILAHPLAFIPIPTANVPVLLDGINSAMNLVKVVDGACLAFLEIKGATTATNWFGNLTICSG